MQNYLFLYRSLTYAQWAGAALERAGISAYLVRTPKSLAGEGCGYSLKISVRDGTDAMVILRNNARLPRRVYLAEDGLYREVAL